MKIICSILNINSNWVGWLSLVAFVVILSANASELTYFVTKVSSVNTDHFGIPVDLNVINFASFRCSFTPS